VNLGKINNNFLLVDLVLAVRVYLLRADAVSKADWWQVACDIAIVHLILKTIPSNLAPKSE